jgi:hypothetical protein
MSGPFLKGLRCTVDTMRCRCGQRVLPAELSRYPFWVQDAGVDAEIARRGR